MKRKCDNLYSKRKGYDNLLTIKLIKKIALHKMSYFPEPKTCSKNKTKIELDF